MKSLESCKVITSPRWEAKNKLCKYPSRRWGHSAVLHGRNLVIFGGKTGKTKEPIYVINCDTFEGETIQGGETPMLRESHSCSLIQDKMIIFGGCQNQKVLNDCFKFTFTESGGYWESIPQFPQIRPRQSHASTVLKNKFIMIQGGMDSKQQFFDDFMVFNVENQLWHQVKNIKGEFLSKAGGSFDNIGEYIYYFGGQTGKQNEYLNDVYRMNFTHYRFEDKQNPPLLIIQKIEIDGNKPQKRSCHASVVFKDRYLLIIGGQGQVTTPDNQGLLNDFWCFDTLQQRWNEIKVPNAKIFKPRCGFSATLYKDRIMIFGGLVPTEKSSNRSSDELFVLWLQQSHQIPTAICNICKFAYCPPLVNQSTRQTPKYVLARHNFQIKMSTLSKLSSLIRSPFEAISMIVQNFRNVNSSLLNIWLNTEKRYLLVRGQGCHFNQKQLGSILTDCNIQNVPFIENNPYLEESLKQQIRQAKVSKFGTIIKLAANRIGKGFVLCYQQGTRMLLALLTSDGISVANIDNNFMMDEQQDRKQIQIIRQQTDKYIDFKKVLNLFDNSRIQQKQAEFTILVVDIQQTYDNLPILQLQGGQIVMAKNINASHSHSQSSKKIHLTDQLCNLFYGGNYLTVKINDKDVYFETLKEQFQSVQPFETLIFNKFVEIKLILSENQNQRAVYYVFQNMIVGKYSGKLKQPIRGFFKLPQSCPLNFFGNKLQNPKHVDSVALPILEQFQKQCRKRKASISVIQLQGDKKARKQNQVVKDLSRSLSPNFD